MEIKIAKGSLPADHDPWLRFLAAIIVRSCRDASKPSFSTEAKDFIVSPWVRAWLKDFWGICPE